ncbi:hypothetical protein OsI_19256 [Oryza sativa Indica Group]|uniref:NmrA-like domain-containing protein n=2 Tax=Oryza sativa TaxID=4530 RepID=B9FNL1_ORYSJ|nr:hypothetical protein OsI_19256 [Oryza sativa Indica Group]EEE63058.1 hypothetical protein OsJ_17866 [Oryza sativa Japonica Group]
MASGGDQTTKSRILVVGGTGYIGRHVVAARARLGHLTTALVKAQLLQSFRNAGVTLLHGDLYDHASLLRAVRDTDVVISAPQCSRPRSLTRPVSSPPSRRSAAAASGGSSPPSSAWTRGAAPAPRWSRSGPVHLRQQGGHLAHREGEGHLAHVRGVQLLRRIRAAVDRAVHAKGGTARRRGRGAAGEGAPAVAAGRYSPPPSSPSRWPSLSPSPAATALAPPPATHA